MKTEKYIDEKGNSTTNKNKAKYLKIMSFDDETGEEIRSWLITL